MRTRDRLFWASVAILCSLIIGNTVEAQNPFTLFGFGANVATNSGNKGATTQRVTLATDQVQLTNALKVDGSAVTQPVSGTVTANMGTVTADPFGANADAASATGSISAKLRFIAGTGIPITGTVTVGSHAVTNAGTFAVQAAESGTWTVQPGNTANTTPWLVAFTDPCSANAKTRVTFSISTATTTQLIAASASNKNYICDLDIVAAGADNVALVEDDTSACASPTAGMAGGTTAATGWNFAANGGLTKGNGLGTVYQTATTNRYTCFITSAAVQLSGSLSYVQVP